MAPRPVSLDQVSQAIGHLEGLVEGIDKYIHDREHNIANLSQKVDGLSSQISREVAAMEGKIEGRLTALDVRIGALEQLRQRDVGAKNVVVWILQSPLVGWIVAGILFLIAMFAKTPPRP